jgi:hypothetical protein
MDGSSEHETGSPAGTGEAGEHVGLGRVVEDRRPDKEGGHAADPAAPADQVEEASEDSFPASDPPPFTSASGG